MTAQTAPVSKDRLRQLARQEMSVAQVEKEFGVVETLIGQLLIFHRGHVQRLPVQAVFVDLGLVPNSQIVRQLVQLDSHGCIVIDDQHQAALPGLFAAGDVTNLICEQILIAIGAGARAAQSAYAYILALRLELESRSVGTLSPRVPIWH